MRRRDEYKCKIVEHKFGVLAGDAVPENCVVLLQFCQERSVDWLASLLSRYLLGFIFWTHHSS